MKNTPLLALTFCFTLVTASNAQILKVEFDEDPDPQIFRNSGNGNALITEWNTSSNALDGTSGGSIAIDDIGSPFHNLEITFGANDSTNWISSGLGDGSSGINANGEFISLSFNQNVNVTEVDLRLFTGDETASLTTTSNGSTTTLLNLLASDYGTTGIIPIDLNLSVGDSLDLRWRSGESVASEFYFEGFTLTAVPEPGTITGIVGGLALLSFLSYRRLMKKEQPGKPTTS
ncbi:hypothetical protein MLD52_12540 [Puniceicoccaceae bacterium K14]|nr:hypothetical protein [Puniceicoccaceae bacterium K14]